MPKSLVYFIFVILLPPPLWALDHRNLDGGAPLTVEDAYPIKFREPAIHVLGFYRNLDGDVNEGGVFLEFEYGIAKNMELGISTDLLSRSPGENEGSGNLQVDLLYNFNTETMQVPAFSIIAGAEFPTGKGDEGIQGSIGAVFTKSIRFNRFHFNAEYTFVDSKDAQRTGRWQAVAGWDHPLQLHSLVMIDFVVVQSETVALRAVSKLEFGYRRQLAPQWILNMGAGTGLSGEIEKESFFFTAGITRSL